MLSTFTPGRLLTLSPIRSSQELLEQGLAEQRGGSKTG